jgi:hypothetical protein
VGCYPASWHHTDVRAKLSLLTGAAAALILNAVFTIEGALREGYHPASDFISELSLGPRGFVQKLNFFVSGGLMIVFAAALTTTLSRRAAVPFATMGVGLIGAGVFDTDELGVATLTHLSSSGALHMLFALLVFGAMPGACALAFATLRRSDPAFARVTLVAAVAVAALVLVLTVAFPWPYLGAFAFPTITSSIGAMQRLTQGAFFAWTAALSIRLFWRSAGGSARQHP